MGNKRPILEFGECPGADETHHGLPLIGTVDLRPAEGDNDVMVKRTQGMNWIRQEKRLAIYMRDGMACVWCGLGVEDEVILTLDHLKPYSRGGDHHESNLVTCCHRCNSSRGKRGIKQFALVVAAYLNQNLVTAQTILAHISRCRVRVLDVQSAKDLIERRGGFVNACRMR